MSPTLCDGDSVLVKSEKRSLCDGEVALARHQFRSDVLIVKRVFARHTHGYELVGDNPDASTDSRTFGVVPSSKILGRITSRLTTTEPQ